MILLKKVGVAFLLVVVLPAGCCAGIVSYLIDKHTVAVGEEVPDAFPLLAVVQPAIGPAECRVLLYKDISALQTPGSSISFLITPAVRSLCNAAVEDPKEFFEASFRIESEQPGRQALLVSASWDDDRVNRGWYEATQDQFIPTKHQSFFGPGLLIPIVFPGAPAWLAYCAILALVARRARGRAAQQAAEADGRTG